MSNLVGAMKQKFKFDEKTGVVIPDVANEGATIQVHQQPPQQENKSQMASMVQKTMPKANIVVDEGTVEFKKRSDLIIFQIVDEQTNTPLGYISGYGLDISFNLNEMRTAERIEQFLEGVKKMFREIMLRQAFSGSDK